MDCRLYSRTAEKRSSRKLGRVSSLTLRPVASFRRSTGRGGMFFVRGMHQRRLMGLVVTTFAAVLVSSCGGGVAATKTQLQIQPLPRIPSKQPLPEVASKHLRML
jgi:hypothetical protein